MLEYYTCSLSDWSVTKLATYDTKYILDIRSLELKQKCETKGKAAVDDGSTHVAQFVELAVLVFEALHRREVGLVVGAVASHALQRDGGVVELQDVHVGHHSAAADDTITR